MKICKTAKDRFNKKKKFWEDRLEGKHIEAARQNIRVWTATPDNHDRFFNDEDPWNDDE